MSLEPQTSSLRYHYFGHVEFFSICQKKTIRKDWTKFISFEKYQLTAFSGLFSPFSSSFFCIFRSYSTQIVGHWLQLDCNDEVIWRGFWFTFDSYSCSLNASCQFKHHYYVILFEIWTLSTYNDNNNVVLAETTRTPQFNLRTWRMDWIGINWTLSWRYDYIKLNTIPFEMLNVF